MVVTLTELLRMLRAAGCPEEVFGRLPGKSELVLKQEYRRLAGQTHPDHNPGAKAEAEEAFKLLQGWYSAAQRKLAQGTYGQQVTIKIASANDQYEGYEQPLEGDLCDLYPAYASDQKVLLKISRHPRNNDLLQAEVQTLRRLDRELDGKPLRGHFPTLIERFKIRDEQRSQRQTNVLAFEANYFTLADVIKAHPRGIDPQDMAWMFNRLLAALGESHSFGIIHGAVLPPHIMIRPSDHNGMLIDWCYSVKSGQAIKAISPPYKADYPPEVLTKQAATAATDLYMAARCMVKLLGGDGDYTSLPASVPKAIRALLRICLISSPHRRANDAWELFEEFNQMLRRLYGKRKFRAFPSPP